MKVIKCPNCNHDISDNCYQCQYCKYVINSRYNNYDEEMYNFLKDQYLNLRNKAIVIKLGTEKFNKTTIEIKEIVDYIANQIYDEENFKMKEKESKISNGSFKENSWGKKIILLIGTILAGSCIVISATKFNNKVLSIFFTCAYFVFLLLFSTSLTLKRVKNSNTFYFSFLQYFIHDLFYKILALVSLPCIFSYISKKIFSTDFFGSIYFWILLWGGTLTFLLYILIKWAQSSTSSLTIEHNKIKFSFSKMNHSIHNPNIEISELSWANYVDYNIYSISDVVETINSIIIYGKIIREQSCMSISNDIMHYKPREYNRLVIRKCFKNNKKLINQLKSRIK